MSTAARLRRATWCAGLVLAACGGDGTAAVPPASPDAAMETPAPPSCGELTLSDGATLARPGDVVLWHARASCSAELTPEYRAELRGPEGTDLVLQEFDPSGDLRWDTADMPLGDYRLEVTLRAGELGSTAEARCLLADAAPTRTPTTAVLPPLGLPTDPTPRSDSVTVLEHGDAQTAYLDQALAPVVVRARDALGRGLVGAPVTVEAPPGARAEVSGTAASSAVTDREGRATLALTLSLQPGPHRFVVHVAGAPAVEITATAIEPPRGTIFSLTQPAHGTTAYGGWPGPGTGARLEHPVGLAVDADGTLYISDQGLCQIFALSPDGVLTRLAGTGLQRYTAPHWHCVTSGSGGLAVSADLNHPTGLALDVAQRRLYLAEAGHPVVRSNSFVRKVNLRDGVITAHAGTTRGNMGWANDWPSVDDPVAPISTARLLDVLDPVLGPDGWLYLDSGARMYRVDPAPTVIEWWAVSPVPGQPRPAPETLRLSTAIQRAYRGYNGFFGGVRFDSGGVPYLAGAIEPAINGMGILHGPLGQHTLVVGGGTSTVADGQPGTALDLGWNASLTMALDGADNLYFADHEGHVIRRLDRATGAVTTVAGDGVAGWGGDYGPASGARIDSPALMVVTDGGHLVFADSGNNTVRVIW